MKGEELVAKSCKYIKDRQAAVVAEYEQLHQKIQDNQNPDVSGETFAKEFKARLNANLYTFVNLYTNKASLNTGEIFTNFTNRLNYNPIAYMLCYGVECLGNDEQVTCQILDGTLQLDGIDSTDIPKLEAGNFWGSSYPAIYGNILYLMARKKDDPVHLNEQSSFMHVAPLSQQQAAFIEGTEYRYQNDDKYGFVFPHTGYAQTGSRLDQYLYGDVVKEFAPKDCSQYVQEMLGHKEHFYTEDMLYTYRHKINKGRIRKGWLDTPVAHEMNANLKMVDIEDVQPGDIHVTWKFKSSAKPTSARVGMHGHTTIVFSKQGSEVVTLGDGQSIPYRDGFGLETYSMAPIQQHDNGSITETVFLRATI